MDDSDEEEVEQVPCALEYSALCKEKGIARCGKWLRTCSLKAAECNLKHYGLGARGAPPLGKSLEMNETIKVLDLSDNGLGAEGVKAILEALTKGGARALTLLSLGRNQAGADGAEAVRELLLSNAHGLARLDLAANAIGDRGARLIAEGLASNTSLER